MHVQIVSVNGQPRQDLSGPGLELPGCSAQDAIRDTLTIHRDPALAARGVGNFIPHITQS